MELSEHLHKLQLDEDRIDRYIDSLEKAKCICCEKTLESKDWAIFDSKTYKNYGLRFTASSDMDYYYCNGCRGSNSHILVIKELSGLSDSEVFELLGMEEQVNEPIYIDGGGEDFNLKIIL